MKLNKERNESMLFGKDQRVDGNQTNFGLLRKNGDLIIGDTSGYFTIDSNLVKRNASKPNVIINNFLLNDFHVVPARNRILTAPIIRTKEIRLQHTQNTFSFEFSSIDFLSNRENIQLSYMLQNYDNKWRTAGESHNAYYFNIPPAHIFLK